MLESVDYTEHLNQIIELLEELSNLQEMELYLFLFLGGLILGIAVVYMLKEVF